jgi:hypothetical protein
MGVEMDSELVNQQIMDLNRRFVSLCTRASAAELPEISVKLNCPMPVLRELRKLSFDEVEAVVSTPRLLLQPAIRQESIERAAKMKSATARSLFISAAAVVQHVPH